MKNTWGQALWSAAAALLVAVIAIVSMCIGWSNREIELKIRFKMETEKIQAIHDNIARIVGGKAGVATEYKKTLVSVIEAQIQGRKGGDMVKVLTESVPGVDITILRDVSNAIEAQRTGFVNAETVILSVVQEQNYLVQKLPSSLVVGGRELLVYKTIKSTNTEKVFATGKDDSDPDPFAK